MFLEENGVEHSANLFVVAMVRSVSRAQGLLAAALGQTGPLFRPSEGLALWNQRELDVFGIIWKVDNPNCSCIRREKWYYSPTLALVERMMSFMKWSRTARKNSSGQCLYLREANLSNTPRKPPVLCTHTCAYHLNTYHHLTVLSKTLSGPLLNLI